MKAIFEIESAAPSLQSTPEPEATLDDRVERVQDAVNDLDLAIASLGEALKGLDGSDLPEAMWEAVSDMIIAVEGVSHEFDCSDLCENADRLGEAVDEDDGDDEMEVAP